MKPISSRIKPARIFRASDESIHETYGGALKSEYNIAIKGIIQSEFGPNAGNLTISALTRNSKKVRETMRRFDEAILRASKK